MSLVTSYDVWRNNQAENDLLIDVRTPAEYAAGFIAGSINLPLTECSAERLDKLVAQHGAPGAKICLVCKAGQRSQKAADQLRDWQGGELWVMSGGVDNINTELQKLTDKNVIPLERQVLIAAGILVLLGVVLGSLLHPGFYAISAFVGAGLTFAGLTGFCGMALLLARMPWNKHTAAICALSQ